LNLNTLPDPVQLVPGELPHLEIATGLATAAVYFHGAHVARWQPSHANAPVLFMSRRSALEPGRPIRGGVPICFPWFGPHPSAGGAPAHGFARTAVWTLTEAREASDGTVSLAFSLQGDAAMSAHWPHAFAIRHRITIGSRLAMTLEVENRDIRPFRFEEALHTYFAVRDVERVSVDGLQNTDYLDKVAAFARKLQGDAPIRFAGETDRVYLDTDAPCVIHDPGSRRIVITKSGSNTTVVWNPWVEKARAVPDLGDDEWREMVCVETANAGDAAIQLAPGATHTMTAEISIEDVREHVRT
jgi:glucose-6-phosphate 1-epimerase